MHVIILPEYEVEHACAHACERLSAGPGGGVCGWHSVCVCVCMGTCACVHARMHVCTSVRVWLCLCVRVRAHVCANVHA